MDIQGVSLSTTCSLDVHWVSLSQPSKPAVWTCRADLFFKCRNVRLSGIQSVRYRYEKKCWCRNRNKRTQSGTGMLQYRTEIQEAGMPMPMPSYASYPPYLLSSPPVSGHGAWPIGWGDLHLRSLLLSASFVSISSPPPSFLLPSSVPSLSSPPSLGALAYRTGTYSLLILATFPLFPFFHLLSFPAFLLPRLTYHVGMSAIFLYLSILFLFFLVFLWFSIAFFCSYPSFHLQNLSFLIRDYDSLLIKHFNNKILSSFVISRSCIFSRSLSSSKKTGSDSEPV